MWLIIIFVELLTICAHEETSWEISLAPYQETKTFDYLGFQFFSSHLLRSNVRGILSVLIAKLCKLRYPSIKFFVDKKTAGKKARIAADSGILRMHILSCWRMRQRHVRRLQRHTEIGSRVNLECQQLRVNAERKKTCFVQFQEKEMKKVPRNVLRYRD